MENDDIDGNVERYITANLFRTKDFTGTCDTCGAQFSFGYNREDRTYLVHLVDENDERILYTPVNFILKCPGCYKTISALTVYKKPIEITEELNLIKIKKE